jgi:hypothetical protein
MGVAFRVHRQIRLRHPRPSRQDKHRRGGSTRRLPLEIGPWLWVKWEGTISTVDRTLPPLESGVSPMFRGRLDLSSSVQKLMSLADDEPRVVFLKVRTGLLGG